MSPGINPRSSDNNPQAHRLVRRTVALVLAGGRGSRLKQLTDQRAKPAVYFGGKFRIIDFALSNCLNSGIRRMAVVTQYKSHSLLRHLQRGWSFLRAELNEMVDLLPAQQHIGKVVGLVAGVGKRDHKRKAPHLVGNAVGVPERNRWVGAVNKPDIR